MGRHSCLCPSHVFRGGGDRTPQFPGINAYDVVYMDTGIQCLRSSIGSDSGTANVVMNKCMLVVVFGQSKSDTLFCTLIG